MTVACDFQVHQVRCWWAALPGVRPSNSVAVKGMRVHKLHVHGMSRT
jgi:hypothetical protein